MIKNILLAEDDRSTALLVKTQLEQRGYHVATAANGLEALKILSAQAIDLLITDVVMPHMDGVDLYEAVKKDPLKCNIPIIIVTDKAMFKEAFSTLGVSYFVEKASNINTLLEKIASVERNINEVKKFSKILISGHTPVLEQMNAVLKRMLCLSIAARTSDEIIAKALTSRPHLIVLDVLFQDNVSAPELIRALRCMNFLNSTRIMTYAYFPEDLGMDVEAVESVKNAMTLCTEAGSDLYIGRFNQGFFQEKLASLGI